jgi:TRAP-type uncharacterized transport system substrate-binding protein
MRAGMAGSAVRIKGEHLKSEQFRVIMDVTGNRPEDSMNLLKVRVGIALLMLAAGVAVQGTAYAQTGNAPAAGAPVGAPTAAPAQAGGQYAQRPPTARRGSESSATETLNAWTVGLAGGQLEGAPIRLATELARVVDDNENLHVLPIVTRGPTENVEDLLYLKGVDVAVINSDSLDQFKTLVPNIQQRIVYILSLFPSELHVFVRPEINSLSDLVGKKVNFNTPGTTAAYSGPLIFDRLKLNVQKTFIPHQVALQQMKAGQDGMEAVVFITTKPVDAFLRGPWPEGFKFLPVTFEDFGIYLPSTLTHDDYPALIPAGQQIETIAIPTILAAYNWPRSSDRYRRVARLTEYLFDRLDRLQTPAFHPAWKNVNLAAKVPGLDRLAAAQEWLARRAASTTPAKP